MEITGNALGRPTSQTVLNGTRLGLILNGNFYTSNAAKTVYNNGYEAAFSIENNLLLQLLTNVDSLIYVTPSGEKIPLATGNFQVGLQSAINACRVRIK